MHLSFGVTIGVGGVIIGMLKLWPYSRVAPLGFPLAQAQGMPSDQH